MKQIKTLHHDSPSLLTPGVLPPGKFYRMSDLARKKERDGKIRNGLLPVGESTIWNWIQKGEFPEPIRIGGVSMFSSDEINEVMEKAQKRI